MNEALEPAVHNYWLRLKTETFGITEATAKELIAKGTPDSFKVETSSVLDKRLANRQVFTHIITLK